MKWSMFILTMLLAFYTNEARGEVDFDYYNGDFESAKKLAGTEGKLFFVDFYANWCAPCKWMEETSFNDVEVKSLLKENYISIKVDIDDLEGFNIKERYQVKILPTMLIFNTKGEMIARVEETLSSRKLAQLLKFHNKDANKVRVKHTINSSPLSTATTHKSFTPRKPSSVEKYVKPVNEKYRIQLGVFQQFENTYDLVNQLKSKFIEPVIVLNDSTEDKMVYKVMMGEFSTKAEAEDYKNILAKDFNMQGIVK